nr:ATP-binding protein [Rhizobacter sp. Root1221]
MLPVRLPVDEPRRLASLQALGILDTAPAASFDALVESAAHLTNCPSAAICLIDERRQWLKAAFGMPRIEMPRERSFCAHTILQDDMMEVPDARLDPRFAQHPCVVAAPHLRLYAGVPLTVDGMRVGSLFVADTRPRTLEPAERDALRRLAHVAVDLMVGLARLTSIEAERTRLLDFARASGDWMWETDAQLRYTWVSGAFEAVTGLPPISVIGQPIANSPLLDALGSPLGEGRTFHDLLNDRQHVTRVLTDKDTARGVLQISRSAVPAYDVHGQFAGYRGTARDVSAHVAGERDAHVQAELLRKLSSQVPGVISQFQLMPDGTLHFLYASDACRDMFGTEPPRDNNGGDSAAVCRALHPDDAPGCRRSLHEAARSLTPWIREFRTLRDGKVRWLESRALPEPHPDGGVLWHGFTADVTARKETELALRTGEQRWSMAAEAAGIGIAQFDRRTDCLSLDAIACANHGLPAPQKALPMSDWLAQLHPADRIAARLGVEQAMDRRGLLESRFRLLLADGSARTLEIFAHCTLDDGGMVTGMLGTCRDVTQQAAHEQLRRDKETAERASRAKSEFLSRVSHELRTPLNGILGFAQLMTLDRVHPLAPDQARRLDSVMHAGHHLLDLINDVLDLARIEQGDVALQRAPVDLMAAVRACIALIQPLADNAGVRVLAPAPTPQWSLGDARAVEQVLINLLSNAIKYNRPAGLVQVTLQRENGWVHLAVSDEGAGLTPVQQAHLFEPFNRLGAEQRRVEGTGLGLVIARALAHAMGGQLGLSSSPGRGSTFTLSLQAAPAPSGAVEPDQTQREAAPPPSSHTRSVLYIEDEPLNQLLMKELFRSRPHWTLHVAGDGTAGLAHLARTRPDLVLADMNLPDMNGLELIRRVRHTAATADLHCVALSADAMQSQIDAALAAGYNAYWTKPIHVPKVLAGIEALLQ